MLNNVKKMVSVAAFGLVSCVVSGAALGGSEAGVPVQFDRMTYMVVSPTGVISLDERGCDQTIAHTTASFEGGTYTAQAGFVQGELMATTFELPASAFPIQIVTTEAVFGTANALVSTTTEWEVRFYEGTPDTGVLVDLYASDGAVLPHLEMGPGTNGTDILFGIDPSSSEQIVIQNNGTNKFTVAWRIVRHNLQLGGACGIADACCNAFPLTDNTQSNDYSQLQAPLGNWLFGQNCPTNCPPGGGWSTFQGLSVACRPHGDWMMRTTYKSLACTGGVGACCLPDGSCEVLPASVCQAEGGTYQGDGSTCAGRTCPLPTGACCFSSGVCVTTTQANCVNGNGTWQGAGTVCGANNTCPSGACCLPTGECIITSPVACSAQQGVFRGVNTTCASANCPQPTGACCIANGASCVVVTKALCDGIPDAWWEGPGTACTDANNDGTFDACVPVCGDLDFNNDEVFPDSSDLFRYIEVFSGAPCPECDTIDFNDDQVFPDNADLFDFIYVLGGGTCPRP